MSTIGLLIAPLSTGLASAQLAPRAGEFRLEGVVYAVARNGTSFQLEVDAFTLPSGKTARLAVPKTKAITLTDSTAIFPRGDQNWRLKPASLRVGYAAFVIGPDNGDSTLTAHSVELKREVEGRQLDYFVARNGSDAANGDCDAPFRTIQVAVNRVPAGFNDEPCVIHIGAGQFAESFDGTHAQLRLEDKQNLILSGAGGKIEGGTQISTGDLPKERGFEVVRVSNCRRLELANLVVGDDKSWAQDGSRETTLTLTRGSTLTLRAVRILGPSRDTILDAQREIAPAALGCADTLSVATLQNVLVIGHGSFLFNPQGKVFCDRVTFARMFGPGYDDHFLFLQTPQRTEPNERRFTFSNCILYEMEGGRNGSQFLVAAGRDGEDKLFFDAPQDGQGGNLVARCRRAKPDHFFEEYEFAAAFTELRDTFFARPHGVFRGDDTRKPLAGGLIIDNQLKLETRDGYVLCASNALKSGWTGGFCSPFNQP